MPPTSRVLGSVDVQGGLWGPDLLAALATRRDALPAETVSSESYGLPTRASTEQAARASWTVLTAAWDEFSEMLQQRIDREGGPNYGTDRFTQTRWLAHLLTQLGYDPEPLESSGLPVDQQPTDLEQAADTYPISHQHKGQVPLHLMSAGVPLDTRTRGVSGADRQSPHSLVQDYLNRTSRHLWAIVTNGLGFRILRDNAALSRQSYVEFDLVAIFAEGAYADFALFWHAAHASRFTHAEAQGPADCIAERWQEHAAETGVAALDDLRDGVEAAIAELGQGFLEHPHNTALRSALEDASETFDAAALYRELLYLVYRHVFWFTLDDRGLLHPSDADPTRVVVYRDHYASTRLRATARAHLGGHHTDGWERFSLISVWFASPDGQPALALPGLLGRLWDPDITDHLNEARITNRRYYEAIRRIAFVNRNGALQRINYDAMGSEELGAVYESLLEIRPNADSAARRFELGRAAGSERRKTGSYYTPTSLIKVLLDEALDPVIEHRITEARRATAAESNADATRAAEEAAILSTTVCDPAMGSGHFLVGAGLRMARRLAQIRTEELEPPPAAVQQAFRDVAARSLFGVDLNPMAVELAKVAIWLECHVPGQPLTFLDHHLKAGNALLGVGFDPEMTAWNMTASKRQGQGGVPDAALKALSDDDAKHAQQLKDRNKRRRGDGGQMTLASVLREDDLHSVTEKASAISLQSDATPAALAAKAAAFRTSQDDQHLRRQRLRADAWIASWTIPKRKEVTDDLASRDGFQSDDLPWDVYYDTFLDDTLDMARPGVVAVCAEAERLSFFHWYLEFPDIAAAGGFDLMLGNPPWERIKIQEKEWFEANGYQEISGAKNAAARKKAIEKLAASEQMHDQQTVKQWRLDSRDARSTSELMRLGGRFPLGGVGDVNTYALFADHFLQSINTGGRVGIIVPTGIITEYTYQALFGKLVDERRLVAAFDFLNRRRLFREVPPVVRFVTLVATSAGLAEEARFAFLLEDPTDLADPERSYTLTAEQIAMFNPNTKTAPAFLTVRDAEITRKVYERHPILIRDGNPDSNPWGISFLRMFDMANDSGLFHTERVLRERGWELKENIFTQDGQRMLPLYEGKLFSLFDADYQSYEEVPEERKFNVKAGVYPTRREDGKVMQPRYWVDSTHVSNRLDGVTGRALLAWRDITNVTTSSRTVQAALLPRYAVNDKALLMIAENGHQDLLLLQACLCSFALDFVARQKISGTQIKYFVMKQLPFPVPERFEEPSPDPQVSLRQWISERSAALSAASASIAAALGYDTPIEWSAAKRELWRTELDAIMFHVYGYTRDDVIHAMDSFVILARAERSEEGLPEGSSDWRAKRLVLEKYDEFARHAATRTSYVSPTPPPSLPPESSDELHRLTKR